MVYTLNKCEETQLGIGIVDAYNELTPNEFAVWIRLMMFSPEQLKAGRKKVAKQLGFSPHQSNALLRRLKNKGYIDLVKGDYPGLPTSVFLTKKAKLAGRNHFMNLANFLYSTSELHVDQDFAALHKIKQLLDSMVQKDTAIPICNKNTGENPPVTSTGNVANINTIAHKVCTGDDSHRCVSTLDSSWFLNDNMKLSPENDDSGKKSVQNNNKNEQLDALGIYSFKSKKNFLKEKKQEGFKGAIVQITVSKRKNKFVVIEGCTFMNGMKRVVRDSKLSERLRTVRTTQKEQARAKKALRLKQGQTKVSKHKRHKNKFIDWGTLDQKGKPLVTFTPDDLERKRMLKILKRSPDDIQKRRLANKLGAEFLRMYTRYRRQVHANSKYMINPKERKWANAAAEACIYKCITPRQYIEYWHERVGEFTGMTFPSLAFLSSLANADTVACSNLDSKSAKDKRRKKKQDDEFLRKDANSFARVDELDSRLRYKLEKAGFNTAQFNDRFLMTVQEAAKAIAAGFNMFVSSDIRPMVKWAAEHIFKGYEIM